MSFDLALINNDLKIQADGKLKIVTDTPKLQQDVVKIILTQLGSVTAHPWYGCSVGDVIGKVVPDNILDEQIKSSIEQSLDNLQTLQKAQSANQKVSLGELIQLVSEIYAERDASDKRNILISVVILSKRLSKVEEYFTLIS